MNFPIRTHLKKIVAGGMAAAVIGGGAVAYAVDQPAGPSLTAQTPNDGSQAGQNAQGGQASPATPGANPNLRHRGRVALAVGEVLSVSTSGGTYGDGTIQVQFPDGKTAAVSVAPQTRIYRYHGPGDRPTKESLSDIQTGEVVGLRGYRGPQAGGTNGQSASTPAGERVLTLVLDTGYQAAGTAGSSAGASASFGTDSSF